MRRDLKILLLAVAGAGVDAVLILGFEVLTAAQTGNTILLATALARGRFATALGALISVAGYVAGAAAGELIIVGRRSGARRLDGGRPWHPAVVRALVAELIVLACLLTFCLAGACVAQTTSVAPIALAAIAMGIQSAAVLRLHYGPTTTYITGTLTTFATETVRWLHLLQTENAAPPAKRGSGAPTHETGGGPWIYGATWIVYGAGAVIAGLVFVRWGELALILPMAAVVAVIAIEARNA